MPLLRSRFSRALRELRQRLSGGVKKKKCRGPLLEADVTFYGPRRFGTAGAAPWQWGRHRPFSALAAHRRRGGLSHSVRSCCQCWPCFQPPHDTVKARRPGHVTTGDVSSLSTHSIHLPNTSPAGSNCSNRWGREFTLPLSVKPVPPKLSSTSHIRLVNFSTRHFVTRVRTTKSTFSYLR